MHIYDALKTGASGYLIKGETMDKIIASIKDVYQGGAPMSFGVAKEFYNILEKKKNNCESTTERFVKNRI